MARAAADSETVRRANRGLVLTALRREGIVSRSRIAALTGLSNASLSAISADLVTQGLVREVETDAAGNKSRGRPAIGLSPARDAAYVALVELDVNRCRLSLVDYGGVLLDRIEHALAPAPFVDLTPDAFLADRVRALLARTPEALPRLATVAISVQGILSPERTGLRWSPIRGLAHHPISAPMTDSLGVPVDLYKRGKLMADGTPWLFPELGGRNCASIFIGATVGMGLALPDDKRAPADIGTEFGHMVHIPDGALCRCGARGCLEAYLADYGVLRTSFGVPERTPPAQNVPAADFLQIVAQAQAGERNARRAFTVAGDALGASISRVMAVVELSHLVLMGPGAAAYEMMRPAFEESVRTSLPGRINGVPKIVVTPDAGEPIFRGLLSNALSRLDVERFAALPPGTRWKLD